MIIDKLSENLQDKIEKIANLLKPYTRRAYLVGGCVRDLFLNSKIKDIDIEVYDINPEDFDKLMQKSEALGVGKSFFVYKLNEIDLALPRVERKVGIGHKAFEIQITDDEKIASKRRDFSMNAMMINIFTGELLDFWEGQQSVENRQISLIDEKSFKEDSLRVLRAIQFSARFGFEIEENTLKIMQNIDLSDLTKPRILWEFEKLFNAEYLDVGFVYMYRLGVLEKLFACKLEPYVAENITRELKEATFEKDLRPYYFLYIVANMSGNDPYEWAKKLEAPNHYLRVYKNNNFTCTNLSDKELMTIAIDLPIKDWLGNYKDGIKERAIKLDIWDEVFTDGITIAKVIEDGFVKENIKIEHRRRIEKRINHE